LLIATPILADVEPASDLFKEADELMSMKKYEEAIRSYNDALDKKMDYSRVHKRAFANLAINRIPRAISDLKLVISGSPKSTSAYDQLADLLIKNGQTDEAATYLSKLQENLKDDSAASDIAKKHNQSISSISQMTANFNSLEKSLLDSSSSPPDSKLIESIILQISELLRKVPRDYSLKRKRSEYYLKANKFVEAVNDLKVYLGNVQNSLPLSKTQDDFVLLSRLQSILSSPSPSTIGNSLDDATKAIKSCLHSDPDNKVCLAQFRKIRKLSKPLSKLSDFYSSNKFNSAFKTLNNEADGDLINLFKKQTDELKDLLNVNITYKQNNILSALFKIGCESLTRMKKFKQAESFCETAIEYNGNDPEIHLNVAKSRVGIAEDSSDPDATINLLNKAQAAADKILNDDPKVSSGSSVNEDLLRTLKRQANRLSNEIKQKLKIASRKDYYKILNVKRDASQPEIKKQFRKLAAKNHPDRFAGEEKKKAENKMAELNLAYEVLKDPSKRASYDNGHDPNDPTSGQDHGFPGGGFHGFPGGFPGGGGGGGFPFDFGGHAGGGQKRGGSNFRFDFGGGGGGGMPFEFHF
ncbi:DnaJ-like protein, partial [Smittium culicis]